jgi:hypothetical protein
MTVDFSDIEWFGDKTGRYLPLQGDSSPVPAYKSRYLTIGRVTVKKLKSRG